MVNVSLKKEERNAPYIQEGYLAHPEEVKNEDTFGLFESLKVDEVRLTEQKENLTALLNKLEDKAKEEVERRKLKVRLLNSEVEDLKRRCEKLSSWTDNDPELECSQTEQ